MKCPVCDYKHKEYEWEDNEIKEVSDDTEEFMEINGSFVGKNNDSYSHSFYEVKLYGCPKCNAIRFGRS